MKCQISEAIEKIDKLISSSSKVDNNIKKQLVEVKIKLNSARDIKMAKMQNTTTGSESKTPEFDKKGFNGYVSIKDTVEKGTPEGDAKDKAMREVANGFIGEFAYRAGVSTPVSSILTSVKTIANKDKSSPSAFGNSNTISYIPKNTANNIDGFTYNSGYYYSKEHIKKTYKITGSSYGKKEDNSNTVPKILAKELVKFMQSIQSDSDVSDIIDYLGENKNNEKNAVDTRGHKLYKDVIELLPKLAKAVRKGQAGGEKYNSISMKDDIDNLFVLLDLGKDLVKKIIEDTPFKLTQDNSYEKDYYSIGSRYIDGLTAGSDVLSVKTVMLAKNSNDRFKESYPEDSYKKFAETLRESTKELIDEAHNSGATFVVGDIPGVDTQFIEYLNEIGASYKVYTTNEAGKEFDRKGIDGSKYRNIVETKSQVETKPLEPDFSNYSDNVISFVNKKLKETNPNIKVIYSEDFFKNETLGFNRKSGKFNIKDNVITIPAYPEDFNKNIEYYAEEVAFNSLSVDIQEYIWNRYENDKVVSKGLGRPAYSKGILINNLKELDSDAKIKGNITNLIEDFEEKLSNSKNNVLNTEIHEKIHAITAKFIRNNPNHLLTKRIEKLFEISKNKTGIKRFDGKNKNTYWAKNVDEFVAEAIGNQEIAEMLSKIDLNGNETSNYSKSIYKALIDALLNTLGLKDGNVYSELLRTLSEIPNETTSEVILSNETKTSEPEIKYGSVVKYKPENGIEGYYIVRGFSANGGLQLTDSEGKNFSGTPKLDKVKFVKQLEIKRYNNVDYIVDSNNRVYTQNGRVANSYENRLLNEFGINKQKQNENEIIKENKNTIKENKSVSKYELFPGVYANEDQENAIDDIKDWYKSNKSNTYLLKGRGGTGKTTIVGEVIKQLGIDSRRVVFAAFSNKAVKVLSNANKDSQYKGSKYLTTAQILKLKPVRDVKTGIQKFVTDAYAEEKVTSSDKIIVIDEASMLPNKQQKEIEAKAKSLGIKIIYMGDDVQLPPVDELDSNGVAVKEALVFDEHKKTGDFSELTKRMRQKGESPILPVTDVLANAVKNELDPNKIVFEQDTEIKNGDGVIFLNKNAGELDIMEMFMKDFKKDPEGTKYIHYNASDNPKTISKNNIIRRELYGEDFNLPENKYMVGEQVIFDNGYFYQDERTGDNVSIDGATEAKVLESDIIRNKPINYFHGRQKRTIKLDVYSVKVQENDSSGIGYIHNIDIPFNLNRLEEIIESEKKDLGVYPGGLKDAFASISYSYVITSHKSQGSTYNNAYVDVGNIFGIKATDNDTKLKSAYVATSRPRHKLVMIGANTNGKTVSVDEAIELIKEDSQAYNPQSEPGVGNSNKYKIISKDDIEAAKDIISNNKKECE